MPGLTRHYPHLVMAGLDPAIQAFFTVWHVAVFYYQCVPSKYSQTQKLDGRVKPGHDE